MAVLSIQSVLERKQCSVHLDMQSRISYVWLQICNFTFENHNVMETYGYPVLRSANLPGSYLMFVIFPSQGIISYTYMKRSHFESDNAENFQINLMQAHEHLSTWCESLLDPEPECAVL
ncbi:hypothetical protein PHYBLDRAFT_58866 [Phycomyces blakesleeanus NRRL 1555(-)]|uniref:Uncharacterized protein n=1 Tax=Phycomyces blakesleeanus (strain ATCC 8743b / DSM 1359 / FGSC 10004 / NBRC 33097 / NRRL 1555) TaxID=763407 RepID=A0A167QK44_PHYB8|nr:hypothetical protein PHYBLDRAFT_58866 [Phycomyces blakesleeanus NRRL 1555(-)]OAD79820.1 hypothetical protein PHYBLDRAFT_58866 [Phycomyces blakesleeanus NRRL 1555(-)]|eukprot:XP_018297860.1 hypothetical protein PHYBLDRAFT_58866 [Phycomyces blakesleeanus NRRL 1555(-)]